jgi:hypothetical protein
LVLAGSAVLISALWIAICAAAPEFIWQGLRTAVGHFTPADLASALLLGVILAFFVEPLMQRTGDLFGPGRARAAHHVHRNPLFTAGLGLAFALVSVCVHDAMTAFVSGRGAQHAEAGSGLAAAIALTIAWSIVPFAVTLAWLSVHSRWFKLPTGLIGGASAGIVGWLFAWSAPEVITTAIPSLAILALGYRRVADEPGPGAFLRCAPVVALVAASWLSLALLLDALLDEHAKFYPLAQVWVDARFYLGWALGLLLAPASRASRSDKTAEPP